MTAAEENQWIEMRKEMVETQLRSRGIRDVRVLGAMRAIPRHLFVPESLQSRAYEDGPEPIGYGQTISQPYIVAYMTERLQIKAQDRVLEIGTGSGYQTAVLAELAKEVYTIEIVEGLYEQARRRLLALGYDQVHFKRGNGRDGWPEEAPFDKIMVTAAASEIPGIVETQLKEGGRAVIPVGETPEIQRLVLGVKEQGRLRPFETLSVRFVPLIHQQELKGKEKGDANEKKQKD